MCYYCINLISCLRIMRIIGDDFVAGCARISGNKFRLIEMNVHICCTSKVPYSILRAYTAREFQTLDLTNWMNVQTHDRMSYSKRTNKNIFIHVCVCIDMSLFLCTSVAVSVAVSVCACVCMWVWNWCIDYWMRIYAAVYRIYIYKCMYTFVCVNLCLTVVYFTDTNFYLFGLPTPLFLSTHLPPSLPPLQFYLVRNFLIKCLLRNELAYRITTNTKKKTNNPLYSSSWKFPSDLSKLH